MSRPKPSADAIIALRYRQIERGRRSVTDRLYEPYIDMDRATEATRRRSRPPPAPEPTTPFAAPQAPVAEQPGPAPRAAAERPAPRIEPPREAIHWARWARPPDEAPDETAWARSEPRQDEGEATPSRYRSGTAWLALTIFAIGGSAGYLTYAAVVAPEAPGRTGATMAVAATPLPDPLSYGRSLAVLPITVPPPQPVSPPYPTAAPETPPYPGAPPEWTVTASAWTVVPADEMPRPRRHRAERHDRIRKVKDRPAKHAARDTQHPSSGHADN
jgi:hypothetical protein